jgi:hypothetical protein
MNRERGPSSGDPSCEADHDDSVLIDTSVAIAQTVGSRNPSAPPPSTNLDKQLLPEAPVGHRQPRADQVPSEKNLMGDPNDPINRENAALDRMTKGICRGC